LLQKVSGALDHCFITTHSIHEEGDLHVYFYVIFFKTRHHAQAHITSGTFIYCAFLWTREEHRRQRSCFDDFAGQCMLWRLSSRLNLVFQSIWGWGNLGSFQLP